MSRSQRSQTGRSAYWQDLVDQWSRSGQTQAAFCRARGITYGSFTWWKRQLSSVAKGDAVPRRSRDRCNGTTKTGSFVEAQATTGSFVEVQVPGSARLPAYELILTRDRVLRIYDPFDSNSVARLIAAVEGAA